MHEEYETGPVPPAVKVAIGAVVAVLIAIVSQVSGFVDVATVFGGDDAVIDDPSTTTVPGTLAFDDEGISDGTRTGSNTESTGHSDDDEGASTRPTIVESIELNPDSTAGSTGTTPTTTTLTSTTSEALDSGSTSTTEDPDEDPESDDTIPPQFDENGDPIPVDDSEQPTENEPVRRTYNDYDSGSS